MGKVKIIRDGKGKVISSTPVSSIKNNVKLTKRESEEVIPEYYSYLDSYNREQKYLGIVSKSGNEAFGKILEQHKVILEYHPGVKHVNGNDEYFTYIDNNGVERIYTDNVEYDLMNNCYIGKTPSVVVTNKIVDIFEEK